MSSLCRTGASAILQPQCLPDKIHTGLLSVSGHICSPVFQGVHDGRWLWSGSYTLQCGKIHTSLELHTVKIDDILLFFLFMCSSMIFWTWYFHHQLPWQQLWLIFLTSHSLMGTVQLEEIEACIGGKSSGLSKVIQGVKSFTLFHGIWTSTSHQCSINQHAGLEKLAQKRWKVDVFFLTRKLMFYMQVRCSCMEW